MHGQSVVTLLEMDCGPKKGPRMFCMLEHTSGLTAKAVQGASLPLQGVDDIHGSDSLSLSVFGVGDGVTDDVLKEDLEDTTGLFVDESRDTLDSSTTCQTTDGGLGDTLDVITQHLSVPLGASLSESLSSLAASSHDGCRMNVRSQFSRRLFQALWRGADGSVARSGCRSASKALSEIIPVYTDFPEIPISIVLSLELMLVLCVKTGVSITCNNSTCNVRED